MIKNMPVRKAVIPAAGLGTRFLPATKAMQLQLLDAVRTRTARLILQQHLRQMKAKHQKKLRQQQKMRSFQQQLQYGARQKTRMRRRVTG